jgi:fatty-acyl-CoA synthase
MTARDSYAHGSSERALLGETIGTNLANTVSMFENQAALVDVPSGRRWTYSELQSWVERVARGLLANGIRKGDRVGIWSPNCPEWVALQYGTALIGAILVNINPAYGLSELDYVLRQSGVRVLVSAGVDGRSDYHSMIRQVASDIESLTTIIYIGESSWDSLELAGDGISPADLAAAASSLSFDEPINIQYTSGTTGFPKGAALSHHNILNNAFFVGDLLGYSQADRVCLPVPFYHCFGMVMGNLGSTTHGSTIVIPAPLFDPEATLRAVEQERCTSLYGVPTMFIAELALENFGQFDLSSLRTGIMAGSPCPVEVMKQVIAEMHMDEVTIAYGMTETSPVSTQTRRDDAIEKRTETVGTVMPHLEIKVIDPVTNRVLPRGIAGELCTRGYSVMLGYWNEPEMTADAVNNGWMHTGDLAVMQLDGYVSVVGRNKDMIIRGGENIYPREIEEFMYTHPAIEDVAVIGVPDPKYGEEICAWVRLRTGEELDLDQLKAFCDGKIAHYKVPRYLEIVQQFPMTITGKVRKVEMREISAARLGMKTTDDDPGRPQL